MAKKERSRHSDMVECMISVWSSANRHSASLDFRNPLHSNPRTCGRTVDKASARPELKNNLLINVISAWALKTQSNTCSITQTHTKGHSHRQTHVTPLNSLHLPPATKRTEDLYEQYDIKKVKPKIG